jgi:3-oxoadipate enol-lactonase
VAGVTIRGVELDHDLTGSGATTLVWGHGLSSSRADEDRTGTLDWSTLGGGAVLRYDARGHGRSGYTPDPRSYSWAELAQDQLALASALGVGRYIAGGASMGCGTALHAAVAAPGRVAGLLLTIPPTAWETRRERVEVWEAVARVVERSGTDGFVATMAAMPEPDPLAGDAERRAAREASARAWDPVRLAGVFRGAGHADLPTREQVRTITVPTLILAWSGDPGHPLSTAEALAELIDGSRLVVARTRAELDAWTSTAAAFLDSLGWRDPAPG